MTDRLTRAAAPGGIAAVLMAALVFGVPCALPAQTADLVLVGGKVATMDDDWPLAEAIAVSGDRILAVGSDAEIRALADDDTRIIPLDGRLVVPGLVDGHLHFPGLGSERRNHLDLGQAGSPEDVAARVARLAARLEPGEWITGSGWHTGDWETEAWPRKQLLDEAAPDNPVLLQGMHSHASWANSLALELAGVTAATVYGGGGEVFKDEATGEPTGVLLENAQDLVEEVVPDDQTQSMEERIRASVRIAHAHGFTGAHDMGTTLEAVDGYRRLIDDGRFDFRIVAYPRVWRTGPVLDSIVARGPVLGYGGNRLSVPGVKMSIDGALGARGAALMRPYSDEPDALGVIRVPYDQLYLVLETVLRNGMNAALHGIGTRGNRLILDAVEQALKVVPADDHRMRVEHAQVVLPRDLPRYAELGLTASIQWIHATLDMPWAEKRVGPERIRGGYAWRTLLSHGTRLVGGSDEGAERFSPFMGIHAAVTRQDAEGNPPGGWYPQQRLTRMEALRSYTVEPARVAFQEDVLGTLTPGKLADLVVLSRDILTVPADEILETRALLTMVGGTIVYQRDPDSVTDTDPRRTRTRRP